jgi:hypothetical protein
MAQLGQLARRAKRARTRCCGCCAGYASVGPQNFQGQFRQKIAQQALRLDLTDKNHEIK